MIKNRKRGSQLARWVTRFLCRSPSRLIPSLEPALWKPAAINASPSIWGWRKHCKDAVLSPLCCTRDFSGGQHSERQMSAQCFLHQPLQKSWHPFKLVQRAHASKCCALWQSHHCCAAERRALARLCDRKASGKMLAAVSPEPPTADGSNISISLLSRWAKCFRPHKCWLERPCVCPRANVSTLQKQERQGCCSNRNEVAREKSVKGKERLWKAKAQPHLLVLAFYEDRLKQITCRLRG